MTLAPAGAAWAQYGEPWITGDLTGDSLFGCNFQPGSTLAATVTQGGNVVWSSTSIGADGGGCFGTPTSVDLVPGMSVTVTDGTTTKVLDLVMLTIDTIDPATGDVSGVAPSGRMVNLSADNGGQGVSGLTTASYGSWDYSFGPKVITPLTNIGASVPDNDGDSTGCNRRLFNGGLNADLTGDNVDLWHFSPNATVTITVTSATGTRLESARVTTDAEGNAWYDPISPQVPNLLTGMHVLAKDSVMGVTLDLRLVPVTFDSFDALTGVAAGTAPPGDNVGVGVPGASSSLEVNAVTDDFGHWQAQFPAESLPFAPMTRPNAWVGVGNAVSEGLTFKIPSLAADLVTDQVTGSDLPDLTPMSVSIYSPQHKLLYSAAVTTDHTGAFAIPRKTHRVDLVPGDSITLATPSSPIGDRALTLDNITIDHYEGIGIDLIMWGTAPAGRWVNVSWNATRVGDSRWVTSDSNNHWYVDFHETATNGPLAALQAGVPDANWNVTTTTIPMTTQNKNK